MKVKINVRYIDFTSGRDGSRIFNFSVSTDEQTNAPASVEIPLEFLVGTDKVPFQDCAGISYAKLQQMLEIAANDVPRRVRLTASDIFEFRKPARSFSSGKDGAGSRKRLHQ